MGPKSRYSPKENRPGQPTRVRPCPVKRLRVLEQTGNDEFALALGYGAIGTLASDLQPFGLASKKAPLDYQSVLDPVSRVIDSVVSDSISNKFVDMTVDNMARDIEKKKDQGNDK